jgi:hypothetical protein
MIDRSRPGQPLRPIALALLLGLLTLPVSAAPVRAFVEGRSGAGELKYINDLPVLCVAGTPEELGRQQAALTSAAAKKLAPYPRLLLERLGRGDLFKRLLASCKLLAPQISPDQRAEMRAYAEGLGIDRDLGLAANMLVDLRAALGCSALLVEARRSTTGGPLFGRNLDFPTAGLLQRYGLVIVRRPKGKHAFVSIGFPGIFGCISGMNDAGLALAVHQVFATGDGATKLNPHGVPWLFLCRDVLEQCTTVDEVEKFVRSRERTTLISLSLCDRSGGAVLEATPKTVALRRGSDGICACANRFCTEGLAVRPADRRYRKLVESRKQERIDIPFVAAKLDEVNQGPLTVQTMIFEPVPLNLRLAMGTTPSSGLPLKLLELGPLLKPNPAPVPALTSPNR